MFHAVDKAAVIEVFVAPDEDAVGVFWFIVEKFADVDVSVDILKSISVFAVILEVSFVEAKEIGFVDE